MGPKGVKQDKPAAEASAFGANPEYVGFLDDLVAYHEKRGTILEPLPKIGHHFVDLHRLYKRVVEEGGYDLCSDTRAKPLMWRSLVEEFIGKSKYAAVQAFQLKQIYYKNLCAYEIATHWKKEPPPKEILEDLTAKGGGVMGRTLENFVRPTADVAEPVTEQTEEGEGEAVNGTPRQPQVDVMDVDAPDSANGARATRGLRHAPPQRVPFQPEFGSRARRDGQVRNPSPSPSAAASTAAVNHFTQLNASTNVSLATYEPRQSYALPLKPVTTPANNPEHFHRLKRQRLEDDSSSHPTIQRLKGVMLPGTGFTGPNIYVRAQLGLQSGVAEEQEYALHHLVKISHERGDKYRFDQFPGLVETLTDKLLEVTDLFYGFKWTIKYDGDDGNLAETDLNGVCGTSDILHKVTKCARRGSPGQLRSADHMDRLRMITEAALVVRNLSMLEENSRYASQVPLLKDCLVVVLGIDDPELAELQNYMLEIAEQLSVYYRVDSKDALYQSLLRQLEQEDRGKLVMSLRIVPRLGMSYPENMRLDRVPHHTLRRICDLLMLEDDELRSACLDFLFQFSTAADQVETLLEHVDGERLVRQLSGLLLHNAKEETKRERPRKDLTVEEHATKVPRLATELIEQLIKFDEPERSSHWLRMCFQEDGRSEITQINLWKAYQSTFAPYAVSHPHLTAGDFIKNVSNTFDGASAQVAPGSKYVIRGIRPRVVPVDYRGRKLLSCRWRHGATETRPIEASSEVFANSESAHCGIFFPNGISMLEHIFTSHLRIARRAGLTDTATGTHGFSYAASVKKFDFGMIEPNMQTRCAWADCGHSIGSELHHDTRVRAALLGRHIQTHLPEGMPSAEGGKNGSANDRSSGRGRAPWIWINTYQDERNDAAGTPLGACLVLRNIARAIGKMPPNAHVVQQAVKLMSPRGDAVGGTVEQEQEQGQERERAATETGNSLLMKKLFDPVKGRLFHAMAYNQVMKDHLSVLLKCISQGTTARPEVTGRSNGVTTG